MIVEAALLAGSVVFTGSLWFAKKMVERADRLDEKKATAKTEIENCPAWDAWSNEALRAKIKALEALQHRWRQQWASSPMPPALADHIRQRVAKIDLTLKTIEDELFKRALGE